jgi:hypothetical protein
MDPLTCDWYDLVFRDDLKRWGCDCDKTPACCHHDTCAVTPIYASVFRDISLPPALFAWGVVVP